MKRAKTMNRGIDLPRLIDMGTLLSFLEDADTKSIGFVAKDMSGVWCKLRAVTLFPNRSLLWEATTNGRFPLLETVKAWSVHAAQLQDLERMVNLCPHLKTLHIQSTQRFALADLVALLNQCGDLEELSLALANMDTPGSAAPFALRSLKRLSISFVDFTGDTLRWWYSALRSFDTLEYLSVWVVPNLLTIVRGMMMALVGHNRLSVIRFVAGNVYSHLMWLFLEEYIGKLVGLKTLIFVGCNEDVSGLSVLTPLCQEAKGRIERDYTVVYE